MRSLLVLAALLGMAVSSTVQPRMQQLVQSLSKSQQGGGHSCSYAINRWKNAKTVDYQSYVTSGTAFTDTEFTTSDALYWSDYTDSSLSSYTSTLSWARARTRITTSSIFGSMLEPWDIKQGSLGDCYYMAAAAAAAEFESRLKAAFLTQTYNTAGIIALDVYVLGVKKTMYIDDYLIFKSSTSSTLLFTKAATDGALWGPFVEKAWAKASGNYEFAIGGWPSEAMRFLTGAPSVTYDTTDYSSTAIWDDLKAADSASLIITAGTPSDSGTDTATNAVGLALCHAYSVIGVNPVYNTDGSLKANLVKMRNPWGSDGSYFGSWSDSDAIWKTGTYATQVSWVNASDGVFYITIEDFKTYFDSYIISHYHDGWAYSTSTVYSDTGLWTQFSFALSSTQEGFLGVDFYTNRMYPDGCRSSYTYANIRVFVNGVLLSGAVSYDSDYFGFVYSDSLPAGTYQVFVKPTWQTNDVPDYTFRTYMKESVTITKTAYSTLSLGLAAQGTYTQYTSDLPTYLTNAISDTSMTWSSGTISTLAKVTSGWYSNSGSDDFLYFYKITDVQTAKACTYTHTFSGQLSGIQSQTATCTSTFDSTTLKNKHSCKCALNPKTGVSSCSYMIQWSGVNSVSISWSYGYSCTTA